MHLLLALFSHFFLGPSCHIDSFCNGVFFGCLAVQVSCTEEYEHNQRLCGLQRTPATNLFPLEL